MKRVLHIEVSSLEGSLRQFGEALEVVMRGEEREPYEGVGFESFTQLLDTLTPKRWALIERLKREGPLTVYALAKNPGAGLQERAHGCEGPGGSGHYRAGQRGAGDGALG
jgi:predicted transcriptional regulator